MHFLAQYCRSITLLNGQDTMFCWWFIFQLGKPQNSKIYITPTKPVALPKAEYMSAITFGLKDNLLINIWH